MAQAAGGARSGKVLLDLALAVALGGDCLSDLAVLRAEPGLFGRVASDPTVSRLVDALAGAGSRALTAIRRARAAVRERVWKLAGTNASGAGGQVIVDIDGVLILAHSEPQLVQGLCAAECLAQQVWHSGLLSGRPITRYVLPQPAQGLVHDRVTSDLACPVGWVGRMSLCPSLIRKSSARMSYGSRGTAARA